MDRRNFLKFLYIPVSISIGWNLFSIFGKKETINYQKNDIFHTDYIIDNSKGDYLLSPEQTKKLIEDVEKVCGKERSLKRKFFELRLGENFMRTERRNSEGKNHSSNGAVYNRAVLKSNSNYNNSNKKVEAKDVKTKR